MGLVENRDREDMDCMPGVYVVGEECPRTGVRASQKTCGVGRLDVLTSSGQSSTNDEASAGSAVRRRERGRSSDVDAGTWTSLLLLILLS